MSAFRINFFQRLVFLSYVFIIDCNALDKVIQAQNFIELGDQYVFSAKPMKTVGGESWIIHIAEKTGDQEVDHVTIVIKNAKDEVLFMSKIAPDDSLVDNFDKDYCVTVHESVLENSYITIRISDKKNSHSTTKIFLGGLLAKDEKNE